MAQDRYHFLIKNICPDAIYIGITISEFSSKNSRVAF